MTAQAGPTLEVGIITLGIQHGEHVEMHTTEPVVVRLVQLATPDDLAKRSTGAIRELNLGDMHVGVGGHVRQRHLDGVAGIVFQPLAGRGRRRQGVLPIPPTMAGAASCHEVHDLAPAHAHP